MPDTGDKRRPSWLKVRLPGEGHYRRVKPSLGRLGGATVCEQARCPNAGECWGCGTATFMILGEVCTRDCAFCAVTSRRRPAPPDPGEPTRVAQAAAVVEATEDASYLDGIKALMRSGFAVNLVAGARSSQGWDTPLWANQHCTMRVNIPDVGHLMMAESPGAYARAILACVRHCEAAKGPASP